MGERLSALPAGFYDRPVLEVARGLLGATLQHGPVGVRLTEVEAYDGANDPASHAFRGRSPRNAVMFGPPGHAYVYFTYGMHFCMNLVCGPPGIAAAVLLRAGEVVTGADTARQRRPGVPPRDLARGPARLCRTLAVDRELNGARVTDSTGPLWVAAGPGVPDGLIRRGPRVGVAQASEVAWRLWIDGEPTVSAYRPHVPRRARSGGDR